MKAKSKKIAKWAGISITILFVLFLIIMILQLSDRSPKLNDEYLFGKMDQVMVGYIKEGKPVVHFPSFYKNDSLLLKNIAGTDPDSKDTIFISPFIEISNGAPPLIGWAFPRWELIIDKFAVKNGRKFNSMTMIKLDKSQGYFYLQVIIDSLIYKRKVRIATADQVPGCMISR